MPRTTTIARFLSALGFGLFVLPAVAEDSASIQKQGLAIYEKLCLECHGAKGEGVKGKADEPLVGNRSLDSLAKRIERTMPEDEPDLCVGEEARAVAAYIYEAFYSEAARARETPARIELSRLTVPQYRQSVADLVLSFRGEVNIGTERGLKALYFGARNFTERKEFLDRAKARQEAAAKAAEAAKSAEAAASPAAPAPDAAPAPLAEKDLPEADKYQRVDAQVRFDFGEGVPPHEEARGFSPEEFSIRWEGTLLPEETGVYEFVVKTRNGVTLWVNDRDRGEAGGRKAIDAWVAPHNDLREESGSVFLVAGRPYPIRLDFFTYKEKAASVELLWKPPHGVLETIPARNLTPDWVHESLILDTPFPADDRSVGYERGTRVSKAWLEAVTAGAAAASDYVVLRLDELARTKRDQPDRREKIEAFAEQFVARAFRRPLSEAEKASYVRIHFQGDAPVEQAVKRMVLQTLSSPRFLYPDLSAVQPDSWTLASRLALILWDSVPNTRLIELASRGELDKADKLPGIVREMVGNWRTRAKVRGFYHHWLEMERADELFKDPETFPEFDPAVAADLRTSLYLFLDEKTWGQDSSYRDLLLASEIPLNHRLGKLYGVEIPGDFQPVALDGGQRAGLITHPYLLSYLAYHNNTSPIHRGVFLARHVLGMALKSPPMANEFKDAGFDPSLTMREKVAEMTKSQDCMACHSTINPLGFSLEHYDGIGRWREQDRGKPVNARSEFHPDGDHAMTLSGARDVAEFAAGAPSAHRAFVEKLFHHLVKQPVRAYGEDEMEILCQAFSDCGYRIPQLIEQMALRVIAHPGPVSANLASH